MDGRTTSKKIWWKLLLDRIISFSLILSLGFVLLVSLAVNALVAAAFPPNAKFLWGKQERDDEGKLLTYLDLYAIQTIPGKEGALIEGSVIESAEQTFDQVTNEVLVNMSMNNTGARTWAQMTDRSAREKRPIAIVLDDIVYCAPVASEKIEGGN